jgi:hypothetical protein
LRYRLLSVGLLICLALLLGPRPALAQAIVRGDTVASGEVIDNDVVLSGDAVRLAGTVKGNAFISGRDVVVDGVVEGSLFVIGQQVIINGAVDGSAYVLALSGRLGGEGSIGQNLYFVGVSLATEQGSTIGRDLNGLSLGAILQGSVGRTTRLVAGLVQFLDLFFDFGPAPEALTARLGRAPGLGQFVLPGNLVFDVIGRTEWPAQRQPATPLTQSELALEWMLARLRELLPLLIVGLTGYWFLRPRLEESAAAIKRRPLPALGIGLVGLVLAAATVGAFILVFVLLLMTGVWIGRATFWNVTWLLWSIAYPLTALVFALLLAFLNYGTKVIVSYAGATYLFDRFARPGRLRLLLLILGLVVYVLLRAIPTLGWVISVLVTAWGIGGAWLAWRARRVAMIAVPVADVVEEGRLGDSETGY